VIALLPFDDINEKTLRELEFLADFLDEQKKIPDEKISLLKPSSWVSKKNPPKCKLAVCLHKADLLKIRYEKAEDVFDVVFGSEWKITKGNIESKYKKTIIMRLFITSSLGFVKTLDNREIRNYVKDGDQIAYPGAWMPWNVERPFLWILEDEEEKEYPSYW